MIIYEVLVIASLLTGGALLLRALGLTGWPIVPLGLLTGIVLFTLLQYMQMLTLWIKPAVTVTLTLILPLIFYAYRWRLGQNMKSGVRPLLTTLLVLPLFVFILSQANLARFHSDSLNFLLVGRAIAIGDETAISSYNINNRLSTVPVVHSLGYYSDSYYLYSVTPLISLSLLGVFCWVLVEGLKNKVRRKHLLFLISGGVLMLISSHAYVFHSFYLNGHLMMGAFMLMVAGAGWLLASKSRIPGQALVAIAAVGVTGLVFTRVEGLFFAGIALLPLLAHPNIKLNHAKIFFLVLGAAILLQQAVKIRLLENVDANISSNLILPLALGAGVMVLSCMGKLRKQVQRSSFVHLFEGLILAALIVLFIRQPQVLIDSVAATIQNTVIDIEPWGYYLVMLTVFIAILLLIRRFRNQNIIRLPITTFLPLAFILAYLRDGAYRVGNADSLNRMLIQVVPVIVLFIIVSIAIGENRFSSKVKRPSTKV